MSIELKIKSKHLSLEDKVIKFEEKKLKARAKRLRKLQKPVDKIESTLYSLVNHRRDVVRRENRATFLARAFIAGKSYKSIERARKYSEESGFKSYVLPRVAAMVARYHPLYRGMRHPDKIGFVDRDAHRKAVLEVIKVWISK